MVNVLSFKTNGGSNVFCFSDFHASHEKTFIIEPRGFKNADEAKNTLITNWNSKVTNNDICFLLGDTVVGAGQNSELVFDEILRRLNYKELYLAPGNHYSGYRQRFNKELAAGNRIDEYYRLSFSPVAGKVVHLIPNYYEAYIDREFVVLSHYSILSFNGQSKSAVHIFGHSHNNIVKSELGKLYVKGRVLEVTPEAIGNYPFSFREIMGKIGNKSPVIVDHHDKHTT